MYINVILFILLVLAISYIVYLRYTYDKKEHQSEEILRRVLDGNLNARLLSKDTSNTSNINFLINQVIENYQGHIINMNNNEKKRKQLLSNISHDIRTPLTSIIGYLDAIRNDIVKTDQEKVKYLEIVSNRSRQLKIILDDIFELAKADSNELILNKKALNINSILTDTLIEFVPILEKENLDLVNNISEDNVFIFADEYSIKRIFQNLINNVITHGKNGGIIGINTFVSKKNIVLKFGTKV